MTQQKKLPMKREMPDITKRAIVHVPIGPPSTPKPEFPAGTDRLTRRTALIDWTNHHIETHQGMQRTLARFRDAGIKVTDPSGGGTFIAFCTYDRAVQILDGSLDAVIYEDTRIEPTK